MAFYLTVDSQNCSHFDRLQGTIGVTLLYTLKYKKNWVVALCQYGLNNGIFLPQHKIHTHIYLATQLVSPQFFGEEMQRILALIPLDFVPEVPDMGFFFRDIFNPEYVSIDSDVKNAITLELKDPSLNAISLRPNVQAVFRLHFKPKNLLDTI